MNEQTKPAPPKVVIAPEGCESYLTAGKEYNINKFWDFHYTHGFMFNITNDLGADIFCVEKICPHLNKGNWIIAEREVNHD